MKLHHGYLYKGKNIVCLGFCTICSFSVHCGSWNIFPVGKGGLLSHLSHQQDLVTQNWNATMPRACRSAHHLLDTRPGCPAYTPRLPIAERFHVYPGPMTPFSREGDFASENVCDQVPIASKWQIWNQDPAFLSLRDRDLPTSSLRFSSQLICLCGSKHTQHVLRTRKVS